MQKQRKNVLVSSEHKDIILDELLHNQTLKHYPKADNVRYCEYRVLRFVYLLNHCFEFITIDVDYFRSVKFLKA